MARGATLDSLVEKVRAETGFNTSTSTGVGSRPAVLQAIRSAQEELWAEYDWPFLYVSRDKSVVAGSRYYDLPADLDYDRAIKVEVLFSDSWLPVTAGISGDEYSIYSSEDNERSDPIQRYEIVDTGSGEQFEVWPLPATNATVRFWGYRNLNALTSGNDMSDLDHVLITKRAAANILFPRDKEWARQKQYEENRRMTTLKKNSVKANPTATIPGGGFRRNMHPLPRLRVARTS